MKRNNVVILTLSVFLSLFVLKAFGQQPTVTLLGDTLTIGPSTSQSFRVYNLRIQNCSFATLRNVIAHISIDNSQNDIIQKSESGIDIFNDSNKVDNSYLSWSKDIQQSNSPQIEIILNRI